jgi:ketosteroid isomerase-like protein
MKASVADVVRQYYRAYEAKDRKGVADLLSDDFTFTSPYDDHIGRAAYFERCWPNSETIRAFDIEKLFTQGNEVFVRYELHPMSGASFRNTEHLTIEDGKIKELDVYFGSLPEGTASR